MSAVEQASSVFALTFANDGAPYWDFGNWQGPPSHKAECVKFEDRPVAIFGSKRVFRAACGDGDAWPQSSPGSNIRSLVCAWTSDSDWSSTPLVPAPVEGQDFIMAHAFEIPEGNPMPPLVTYCELHESGLPCKNSPCHFAIYGYTDGKLYMRLMGGDCTTGGWTTFWNNLLLESPCTPGLHCIVTKIHYARDSSGRIEAWHSKDGKTFDKKVDKGGQATWVWGASTPQKVYPCAGIYPASNPGRPRDKNFVWHYGNMFGFASVEDAMASFLSGETPPSPPGTHHYESSIKTGDTVAYGQEWTVTTDDPAVVKARFFADNVLLEQKSLAGGEASTILHLPVTSDNGGVTLHKADDVMVWGSGSIDWTVTEQPPDPPDPPDPVPPSDFDVTGTAHVEGEEITLNLKLS